VKLILYSTDGLEVNTRMDKKVRELLPKDSRITYIPSCPDPQRRYFKQFKSWFGQNGFKKIEYFDLDREFDFVKVKSVLESDAIYLSGGNTFGFLHLILKRKFRSKLKNFVKAGGVLIGTSAGVMLMTPSIETTREFKGDSLNDFGVNPNRSLGLVNFEFFPHYNNPSEFLSVAKVEQALLERSRITGRKIIACREGEGLIIWDGKVMIVGEPVVFKNGKKLLLKETILIFPYENSNY
jgi:dipeptidase E